MTGHLISSYVLRYSGLASFPAIVVVAIGLVCSTRIFDLVLFLGFIKKKRIKELPRNGLVLHTQIGQVDHYFSSILYPKYFLIRR